MAGAEDVIDDEAPLDLAFSRFVRLAVGGGFRLRAVAPVPFDRRAVVLLEVVGAAHELGPSASTFDGDMLMTGCAFSVSFGFLSEPLSFASLSSFRCAVTATDRHGDARVNAQVCLERRQIFIASS